MTSVKKIQDRLKELGFDSGPSDGDIGKRTIKAIMLFQASRKLKVDGFIGPVTEKSLFDPKTPAPPEDPEIAKSRETPKEVSVLGRWPRQAGCTAFYGEPGNPDCTAGVVRLPAPMRIAWDLDDRITTFRCHKLVASPMETIFKNTLHQYGEALWRELGLDIFGGCYNLRKMRGGSAWSMHSWGIAVDIDPEHNQLKWDKTKASLARPECEPFWRIVESVGAVSLGRIRDFDWMHFQFAKL